MMQTNTIPGETMIGATPESKSWVATRFVVINDCGIAKRRCTFVDCGKEYARGTSHMILKRHWSKAHNDVFSVNSRTRGVSGNMSSGGTANKTPTKKKSPLKSSNSCPSGTKMGNFNSTSPGKARSNDKNLEFDLKMVSRRLREAASIHLTFDIYTPKKGGKTYGIITAHSLSESYDIRSVLLEYKHLPYPDDSSSIYEFLRSCITRFNCREKIISIASNSSEVVASAIQELDKRYRLSKNFNFSTVHIKCFPQFVHENVIEVLRSQETTLLSGIRKIVGFINSNNFTMRPVSQAGDNQQDPSDGTSTTQQRNESSASIGGGDQTNEANDPKATGLKLPLDNKSSWNTTFNMIDTFWQQREFIQPTLLYFQQDLSNINIDWDKLYALVQLLKPFYDVIDKFATDNYTPVSLIAAVIPYLMDHLSNSSWGYADFAMVVHQFKSNLDSYRQCFQSDLIVIAGLLDPRIKDTFTSSDGRSDVINILRKRMGPQIVVKPEYEGSIFASVFVERNPDEILDYLERQRESGKINVFAYWETYKHSYPTMYNLAKILACVQATSVPSDRMFSAAEHAERERKMQTESTNSKELMRSWARYLK